MDPVKTRVFIEEMGLGRQPTVAARRAGFSTPDRDARKLLDNPEVLAEIQRIQQQTAKKAEMTREDVMANLMKAFRLAESTDDPQSMIRAMAEVNRMCGHYAPEKKQLEVTGEIQHYQKQIEQLSKEDLLKLIAEEEETPLLEAMEGPDGVFEVEDGHEE